MPYTITTKDGAVTLRNIPDNIDPNSDVIRERVLAERAKLATPQPRKAEPIDRAAFQEPTIPEGLGQAAASITEPLATMATGAAGAVAGGLTGIASLPFGAETAARNVRSVQDALTFQPQTEAGINSLTSLGNSAPIQAMEQVSGFTGDTLQEGAQSLGLPPEAIAAAGAFGKTIPTAIGLALGAKAPKVKRASVIDDLKPKAPKSTPILDKQGAIVGVKAGPVPKAPGKGLVIANKLKAGSKDADTAGFRLNDTGTGVVPSKIERAAIKQGFKKGSVAALRRANTDTKAALNKMVDIVERVKNNATEALHMRPSDVLGDALGKRIAIVRQANRTAGKQLDGVADSLKGQLVSAEVPVNNFMTALDEMGVKVGRDLVPKFKGSAIQGIKAPQKAIREVIERMKDIDNPDAFAMHQFKRFLDERLDFGKSPKGGLAGKTQAALKKLRHDVDQALDAKFAEYKKVNDVFSETITVLDDIQTAAGKKIDLNGPGADSALGTLTRRITSNAQSRVQVRNMVESINKLAQKHNKGAALTDDLDQLMVFANELDAVFKPVSAENSFAGQIIQSIPDVAAAPNSTIVGLTVDAAKAGIKKAQGVNEAGAFKAIRDLIK